MFSQDNTVFEDITFEVNYLWNNGCLDGSGDDMDMYTTRFKIVGVRPKMLISKIDHSLYGQNLTEIKKTKFETLSNCPVGSKGHSLLF
jgi:hypothetical protein